MQTVVIFLVGFLLGGLVVRWVLMLSERRDARAAGLDPQYAPARRALLRYLRAHGTVNLPQAEQMLSLNGVTVLRYLDRMEHEHLVKPQNHRGTDAFYTLA